MKYRAILTQVASCVVTFDAPEDATPAELAELASEAETPSLCWQCADGDRNQSLNIDGEWELYTDSATGQPAIHKDGAA